MPTYYGPANNGKQLRIDVSWTQSVSGNYSDVRSVMYIICNQWVADSSMGVGMSIAGNVVYQWVGYARYEAGTSLLADQTQRVYHNASGAGSVTIGGSVYANNTGLVNVSIAINNLTLPTIPRQPSAPSRPSASAIDNNSMTVKFSHQGSIPATQYQLQRSTSSNFSGATTISSSGTSNISGLTPGTTYYYRARSGNAAGWSGWSSTLTTYTQPQANTPTIDTISATGMRVVFGRTGGNSGSTTWELQRATNSSFTAGVTTISSTGTSVISGLVPGTTYYYRARGKNSSGTGPWSGTRSATTSTVPAPGLAVVSGNTGAAATATITAPAGATITNYTLEAEYLSPLPKPSGADKSLTTTSLSPTVTGLRPGASYRWRVRANIGTSYSTAWSSWVTVTQVNPNTLDAEYFDSTMTSTDPDITRDTASVVGITVSRELAVTPLYWSIATEWFMRATIRRGPENMVPSTGSTKDARVKVLHNVILGESDPINVLLSGHTTAHDLIPTISLANYTAMVTAKTTLPAVLTLAIRWYAADGTFEVELGPTINSVAGEAQPLRMAGKSPEWSVGAKVAVLISESATENFVDLDGGLLALGRPESYFDGGTPDTFRFDHEWAGVQWNSESLRIIKPNAVEPDPFLDPNCPPPPAPPRPPLPVNECIPVVDTWRRYWSPLSSDAVSAAFDSLPIFTITSGGLADGPVRVLMFENPGDLSVEDFIPGEPVSEQVVTYIPPNSEAVLDAVSERSYGRVLGSTEYQDIDHLVFGASGGPATWPVLSCNQSYMIAIDVPGASPLGNIVLTATLTTRMG